MKVFFLSSSSLAVSPAKSLTYTAMATTNWGKNVRLSHAKFVTPSTLQELQEIVKHSKKVRVIGSGHSFAPIANTDEGTLISLTNMRAVLAFDTEKKSLTIEAGATLTDVIQYLAPRGYALKNLPSLPHITVAGAVSTGTHGTGLTKGHESCLSSLVNHIEFVIADGSLKSYSRGGGGGMVGDGSKGAGAVSSSSPSSSLCRNEEFGVVVVNVGLLGVISSLSIDIIPSFTVTQHVYRGMILPSDFFGAYLKLAHSCDSFTTGWNMGTGEITLWLRYFGNKNTRGDASKSSTDGTHCAPDIGVGSSNESGSDADAIEASTVSMTTTTSTPTTATFSLPTLLGAPLLRESVPFYELGVGSVGVATTRFNGAWHDVPTFFMDHGKARDMPCEALQSEFFVPLENALQALEATYRVASKWPKWLMSTPSGEGYSTVPVVFHCEIRVVPSDGLSGLSQFGDRDEGSCCIHFTWGTAEVIDEIMVRVKELEEVLKEFHARPHWGKLNTFKKVDLKKVYSAEALEGFMNVVKRHDAEGKFVNEYLREQVMI